jgi:serine/threonine protein kinase
MTIEAGQQLSHYRLIEKIGEGGMGVVWKASDARLDRHVAIKVLPGELTQNPDRVARFHHEAQLSASFQHPNIATVHDVGEQGERSTSRSGSRPGWRGLIARACCTET